LFDLSPRQCYLIELPPETAEAPSTHAGTWRRASIGPRSLRAAAERDRRDERKGHGATAQ